MLYMSNDTEWKYLISSLTEGICEVGFIVWSQVRGFVIWGEVIYVEREGIDGEAEY